MLEPTGSPKYVSHKARLSGQLGSRKGSQVKKLEQKPWILLNLTFTEFCEQGLMQKQNVDIDGENDLLISIVAKNIVTQEWSHIVVMESKQAICYIYFTIFSLLYYRYYLITIIYMIKKLELQFLMVLRLN